MTEVSNPPVVVHFPGTQVHNAIGPVAWTDLDLSAVVGARKALVYLRCLNGTGFNAIITLRPNGDGGAWIGGVVRTQVVDTGVAALLVYTDAAGIIEWYTDIVAGTWAITVEVYAHE